MGELCAALAALAVVLSATTPPPKAEAGRELNRALAEAKAGHLDQAFLLASQAAASQPDDRQLVTVREFLRQRAALAHLERAHGWQLARHPGRAALEYRTALAIDPSSLDARQGLAAMFPAAAPPPPSSTELRVRNAASPIEIEPAAGDRDFHIDTNLRTGLAIVAAAYGLRAYVADQVPNTALRLDLTRANFAQAMAALHGVSGVDWVPLDTHTLYFAGADQLRQVQPMALRTFYLPWVSDGIELSQIANVLRSLLGIQEITPENASRALSVRAAPDQLDAAEKLLLDLDHSPGQVLLEIKIMELNDTMARDLGLNIPNQFTMFALGPLLAELQQSSSLSQSILQLFEQGGLNAVLNSGQLGSGALSQITSQLSPLLQNPFVVFGGGATLMALSVPGFTAKLTATQGRVTSLETALMRAEAGQSADLKIGQRFPIINASFSPISLSPAISKVIGNGSFIQPFPSFTYENLGLDAKITPYVAPAGDVRLQVEITVNGLTGVSSNNIPILSNRHLVTEVGLSNNEPVMLAGLFSQQEMATLSGLPGLSQIPGFGRLFSTQSLQTNRDQLVLVVTPHIVQLPGTTSASTWLPASFAPPGNAGFLPPPIAPPPARLIPATPFNPGGGSQ